MAAALNKADSIVNWLKSTDVAKFTDILYSHARKLLAISERERLAGLLGSIIPTQRSTDVVDARSSALKKTSAKGKLMFIYSIAFLCKLSTALEI